jgi:hypothetical protein
MAAFGAPVLRELLDEVLAGGYWRLFETPAMTWQL